MDEKSVWEEFQFENIWEEKKLQGKQNTHDGLIYKQVHLTVGFTSAGSITTKK